MGTIKCHDYVDVLKKWSSPFQIILKFHGKSNHADWQKKKFVNKKFTTDVKQNFCFDISDDNKLAASFNFETREVGNNRLKIKSKFKIV